jgi:uncharacterized protein (TIGR02246 family)
MQPRTFLGAALALSLSVAPVAFAADTPAPATAPDAAKAGPSDKAQIAALEKRFTAAFNAKDVDKIMAAYARNGLFVYDVAPPREYVGWEAYKKDWEGLLKEGFPGPIKFSISDLAITTDGNMAYSHSTQTIDAPGNATSKLVVRVTDVYRKTGGRWQIVHEHVSVPVDMATGKGDLLSKP